MNNDLISREALKKEFCKDIMGGLNWESIIDNAPTVEPEKVLVANVTFDEDKLHEIVQREVIDKINSGELVLKEERPQGKWNNHTVACLLAELFGDTCACNFCGIDEWLPKKCDFANKECPDVVGVACWEQFLKHRKGGAE